MLRIIAFLSIISIPVSVISQGYTTAAGLRLGNHLGLSLNQRLIGKLSLEGIVQSDMRDNGYAQLLLKKHSSVIGRGFNLYAGAGGHLGYGEILGGQYGVSGIVGVELSLFRLNVSLDYVPMVHLATGNEGGSTGTGFSSQGAMSVRYIMFKANNKKHRHRLRDKRKRQRHKQKAQKARSKQGLF